MNRSSHSTGSVRFVLCSALIAALTQGRELLLRNQGRQVEEARADLLGEEAESDFFVLMRAWRYAERNGFDLRRVLWSADCFSDRAIARGSSLANVPCLMSRASLLRATSADHLRLLACFLELRDRLDICISYIALALRESLQRHLSKRHARPRQVPNDAICLKCRRDAARDSRR